MSRQEKMIPDNPQPLRRQLFKKKSDVLEVFCKMSRRIGPVFLLLLLAACGPREAEPENQVLIRVRDRVVTVLDFTKAFEIAETAYSNNIRQQSEELRKAKLRLLNQMTVEMILLERAEELGVNITDAQLAQAVNEIKSDYPEGQFEETLLEFAISYDSWESRLKARLIMEAVIEKELKDRISITPEDIADYYQKNYPGRDANPESAEPTEDINEVIVKNLRREKAEEAYQSWIKELKDKYVVEINSEQLERITGSKSIEESE